MNPTFYFTLLAITIVVLFIVNRGRAGQRKTKQKFDEKVSPIMDVVGEMLSDGDETLSKLYRFVNDKEEAIVAARVSDKEKVILGTSEEVLALLRKDISNVVLDIDESDGMLNKAEVRVTTSDGRILSYEFITKPIEAKKYIAKTLRGYAERLNSLLLMD